jgi:hypothetical protein
MLLTLQLKLKIKKGHTPSSTTVTITVYLKENGNKKTNKKIMVLITPALSVINRYLFLNENGFLNENEMQKIPYCGDCACTVLTNTHVARA